MTDTAALTKPENKRRALLALCKLADQEANWLRFTDRQGRHVTMQPERVRDLIDNRYYQDQDWQLFQPLDYIAEKADALARAHDEFDAVRRNVVAWFHCRREAAAAADAEAEKEYARDAE